MKKSNFSLRRTCSSVVLLMVAVAAAAGPGGADSPFSGPQPPFRELAGFVPEPGYDPCLFSPALSGCLSIWKALQENQQALAEERSITGLFRALIEVKSGQSRLYIEKLNDLNAVRGKLAECEVTLRTPGNALTRAAIQEDIASQPAETSRPAGDVRQVPEIQPSRRIASPDKAAVEQVSLPASADAGLPPGDYASDLAFSQEVLRTIDINSALNIRTDKKALIAGFSDKMSGAVKYSAGALLAAMSEKQKEVASAREKTLGQQMQKGDSAVMRFQASPGVVKTPEGFLYRIERRGDAPLKKDVPLRLVVKESLADGTSLLDMVADGSELRQNVDDMPPIFKEVIGKMALNGSATIMVPPELAYGEEGKPTHIPLGATLIYWFEIRGY
ncbi:FKBP-type peptidyl-prolyl cis-trans isomerase (plasmid) [Serratia ureilytica]|uniref:FKBP-type peptidyl-prolyl cis-trans isomerase n=1 Tax=Serratia ureilytica TaxID=300181 RepID=UPI00164D85E5|nr:FKBP-type peptidyl-prolyl cis-trans isomerase [Serratia ureilytica]QNL02986.1 FKBP-type peptidyl-prolyl cis-trans isomerase [Serratia ureilytica]